MEPPWGENTNKSLTDFFEKVFILPLYLIFFEYKILDQQPFF